MDPTWILSAGSPHLRYPSPLTLFRFMKHRMRHDRTLRFSFRSFLLNIAGIALCDNAEQRLEARALLKGAPQLYELSHRSHTPFHPFQLSICEQRQSYKRKQVVCRNPHCTSAHAGQECMERWARTFPLQCT